ncbi:MAG: 50S ribosomal protein L24 [Oscillospiraceae bacterium]|nr:50S ribosomal protein L24 [Oscillospiraceae bacterium]
MNNKVHVKSGDTVVVINGKNRGKQGKVLEVSPKEGKVIVEGVNMVTKHVKPRQMGEPGGLIKAESALYADKVQLVCPKCGKPTRVGHVIEVDEKTGKKKKYRVCKKENCGAKFE